MTTVGQLEERITFGERLPDTNDMGGTLDEFTDHFTVWARRQFLRGGEGIQAARLDGRQPVALTVRASSQTRQITTAWRAKDARTGDIYQIRSVEPSEDRAWIGILCERGVAV